MQIRWLLLLALAAIAGGCAAKAAVDPVAPPNRIQQAKIIAWGNTPSPAYVRQNVREMERLPVDGLVMTICANGYHDLTQKPARQRCFASI